MAGQTQGLASGLLVDISQLEEHAARLDDGDPVLGAALTGTHSGAGRLLGNGLVGEDLDPDLAATLDITGHGNTGCLDLVGGDPSRLESDQAVIALVDLVAAHGLTGHAAALNAAVLNTLRQ